MNKSCLLLCVLLMLGLLGGCGGVNSEDTTPELDATVPPLSGQPAAVDLTDLTRYDLDCGLSFYGPSDMKEKEVEGFSGYISNSLVLVMIIEEPKEGTILADYDAQGYADLLTGTNGIANCVADRYGNLASCYINEGSDGLSYYYYLTIKETENSFWMVQMTTLASAARDYADRLAQWSATIVPTDTLESETTPVCKSE